MNTISSIIKGFTEDNKKEFINFLQKKNRRGDAKNIRLFKLIDSDKRNNLDVLLYGKPARNAYHALCKRLQDNLIDFVASKSFAGETSEEMDILKLLLASRIFFEHRQFKVAFKTLEKAERNAMSLELYSILNEIYHTKIQYAHLNSKISLPKLFTAAEENTVHFRREQQLNMAYASIKEKLSQPSTHVIKEVIINTFKEYNIEVTHALTYKSLFQLMQITATIATLRSDYFNISEFMTNLYDIVSEKKSRHKNNKNLYYHIEILSLMAVTHFRNKNFKKSQAFAKKMENEMQKEKNLYYNRFSEKLVIIKSLNQNFTGAAQDALNTLNVHKKESLDIDLLKVMVHFQQSNFNEAYVVLKNMHHSDIWYEKKMGLLWVLKKSIIEILLLIELNRLDLVLSRLQSFKKKFSKRLKQLDEERVIIFIKLVSLYYEDPLAVTSETFKEKVEHSFNWIGKEREDIFVMSFYAWLKSKMTQDDLYKTTLELVG